jgi:hypothetical protein
MRIQINAHTSDGVWGYMVTVWDGATCVAQEWFATMPALPSSDAKEGT